MSLGLALAVACFAIAAGLGESARHHTPTLEEALRGKHFTDARLAHPAASAFVETWSSRQLGHVRPRLPLATMTALEAAGDSYALGVAHLAQGEIYQARKALNDAGDRPDVQSDLVALEIEAGEPEAALIRLDKLLEKSPNDPRANWNRALALQALGLDLAAAGAFDKVADADEPGWGAEARSRAYALRRRVQDELDTWHQIYASGDLMLGGGPPINRYLAQLRPGPARLLFYAALASAESSEQAKRLKPYAKTLDELAADENQSLEHQVDAVAAQDFVKRKPLAKTFQVLYKGITDEEGPAAVPAERDRLSKQIAEAIDEFPDIELAVLTAKNTFDAPLEPYKHARRAWLPDPWYEINEELLQAEFEFTQQVDYSAAELRLRQARSQPRCRAPGLGYVCLGLDTDLVQMLTVLGRLSEAESLDKRDLARAHAIREYGLEGFFYEIAANTYRVARSIPLCRAYLEETMERGGSSKQVAMEVHLFLADAEMLEVHTQRSLEELKLATQIKPVPPLIAAQINIEAFRRMGDEKLAKQARDFLAVSEKSARRPEEKPFAKYLEAMLETSLEPARTKYLDALAESERLAPVSEEARKISSFVRMELAFNAAQAGGHHEDVVAWLARDLGVVPPEHCVLAMANDSGRVVATALGPDKTATSWIDLGRPDDEVDLPREFPTTLLEALHGCEVVDVLARAPLHGRSRLLPPELAWRHRAGTRKDESPDAHPAVLTPKRLVVYDTQPPSSLELPHLATWSIEGHLGDASVLRGPDATPTKVLAQMENATEVEIHAHGFVDMAKSEASMIALSPEAGGRYALTVPLIRAHHLRGHPVVLLAACRGAVGGSAHHKAWSLPAAFIEAGARAVFASSSDVPDAEGSQFFGALLERIRGGANPAVALRDERVEWLRRDPKSWVQDVVLFQ
jgi:hypothetical protein